MILFRFVLCALCDFISFCSVLYLLPSCIHYLLVLSCFLFYFVFAAVHEHDMNIFMLGLLQVNLCHPMVILLYSLFFNVY